jgi:outer membrane protein TolC
MATGLRTPARAPLSPGKRLTAWLLICLAAAPAALAQDAAPAPPPLTLEDCVRLGLEKQPSLAAARASLAAAEVQQRALENLRLAGLISAEVPIRREQAALGVTIATAGLHQAEWETTYAVTRNFFSMMYAKKQEAVAREVERKLRSAQDRAKIQVGKGDPDSKIRNYDVDKLAVHADLYKLKVAEAEQGFQLAAFALAEAMGMGGDCRLSLVQTDLPPVGETLELCRLVELALQRRGEIVQATSAVRVTDLEVDAQGTSHALTMRTFAASSDIHSREIPQGVSNTQYRPSAIGLDMPTLLAGRRHDRMDRAREFNARAAAVADKATNLIRLEVEAAFLKWQDADRKVRILAGSREAAARVAKGVDAGFFGKVGDVTGEEYIRGITLADSNEAAYNEALYYHALALAALERVTAGGFTPSYRRAGHP